MRPLRIIIENFMSHRYTDIDCTQFSSVLIVGRQRSDPRTSMGVGKSNVFKAIEYVLFGEAQISLDKIIRHGCDRCKITFEFEVDSQIYQVIRSRSRKGSKSDLRMFKKINDSWVDITQKTATETEQELSRIIKISHVSFRSSILFAQADLYGLPSITPNKRKAMLKEPLQISAYTKYEKIAKEKTTLSLKELDRCKLLIDNLGNPQTDLDLLSVQSEEIKEQLKSFQEKQHEIVKQLDVVRNELISLQSFKPADSVELYRQLNKIQTDKKIAHEKIKSASSSLTLTEQKLNSARNEFEKSKTILLQLEENYDNLVKRSVRTREEIKADIAKITEKEINGKAYISGLQSEKIKLSKPITDQDICDNCSQPVTQEHRQICEEKRKKELDRLLADFNKYVPLLDKVKIKRSHYEKELIEFDSRETSLFTISNKISSKKKEMEQNDSLIKQLSELIELRKNELKTYIDAEQTLVPQENILKKQIEACKQNDLLVKIDEVKKKFVTLEFQNKTLTQDISNANVNLGVLTEKISVREKDKSRLIQLKEELLLKEKEFSLNLKVQQAFSSSGIPTMIINTVLDDLQIVANDLLIKIRPEIEIVFLVAKTKTDGQQEDTLDIVYRINGIEYEYEQLSGGQKVIVALCLKRALSLVIQHRIGVEIKFLMLDEVDAQFDDSALESFIEIIKKWQEQCTVFVISHNKMVKDKFTHAILLEGDENGTVGSLSDSW